VILAILSILVVLAILVILMILWYLQVSLITSSSGTQIYTQLFTFLCLGKGCIELQ